MGLESATYIEDLVGTNPTGADDKNQGDNHLRLIKDVLQNQFPNLGDAAVTTTAVELNKLDGCTSSTSELNKLDGCTATTEELNKMDGCTASTSELNRMDGVTSSVQDQIDTKSPKASPTFTGTVTATTLDVTGNSTVAGNEIITGDVTANNLGEINYYVSNGVNTLLAGSNVVGDTSLELEVVRISGVRVGNAITLAGRIDISGFSIAAPNDSPITVYLDISAALAEVDIVSFGANDTGTGSYILQASGFDFSMEPIQVSTFGTKQLRFLARQVNSRRSPTSLDVQTATSLELNFSVVIPNCSE